MLIDEDEALASLKVLMAVAKADGRLTPDEKRSLSAAVSSLQLPVSISVDDLLTKEIDVAAELAKIVSTEAKEQLFRSAHFMANADGVSAPEEKALLAQIEATVEPSEELRARMKSLAPPPSSGATAWLTSLKGFFGK